MKMVIAVLVSYNRKELLIKCLSAITKQTRKPNCILIIDNASTDGTRKVLESEGWLSRDDIKLFALEQNIGGAGGFNLGVKNAYLSGADWIWLMDDDCVPRPDCLEQLLLAEEKLQANFYGEVGFLASRVLWKDYSPCLMNLPAPHRLWMEPHRITASVTRISASSFVSMLVNRLAVAQFGLPVKEFFIWFDDAEYSKRISSKMPCFLATESVIIHNMPNNISPLDFNFLDEGSLWKFKCGIRNECSVIFENSGFIEWFLFVAKQLVRLSRCNRNWHLRYAILVACLEGLRFRYRRFIEFV